jgi:NAD(P)-dependent dehydrogenase (short-subunit alcohol dehydrogenase family)
VESIVGDVASRADVKRAIDLVVERFGHLDVAAQVAGIAEFVPVPGVQRRDVGPDSRCQPAGHLVEASIFGDLITGSINGVEVISVTDSVLSEGSPGIGFNFFVGETNVDHGFSHFEVDTWDD